LPHFFLFFLSSSYLDYVPLPPSYLVLYRAINLVLSIRLPLLKVDQHPLFRRHTTRLTEIV
jgi:hypothetical protein